MLFTVIGTAPALAVCPITRFKQHTAFSRSCFCSFFAAVTMVDLKGRCREEGARVFQEVHSDTKGSNRHKLQQRIFQPRKKGKKGFTTVILKHWTRCSGKVWSLHPWGCSPCAETALCSLMQLPAGPALSRGLDQVISGGASQPELPYDSVMALNEGTQTGTSGICNKITDRYALYLLSMCQFHTSYGDRFETTDKTIHASQVQQEQFPQTCFVFKDTSQSSSALGMYKHDL